MAALLAEEGNEGDAAASDGDVEERGVLGEGLMLSFFLCFVLPSGPDPPLVLPFPLLYLSFLDAVELGGVDVDELPVDGSGWE